MDLKVKVYRSICEIDKDKWDAIVAKEHIFCSHGYVATLEKSGIYEGRCYYPVVYNGDEMVAHACVYSIDTEMDVFAQGVIKNIVSGIRRKWKDFLILKSLECGPPIALGKTLSIKDGVDRTEVVRTLCQSIENLAKELSIKFVLFRDFYEEEMASFDPLKERGYKKIHNLPKAQIDIKWKSFDEYLNSMRSNYRCKIVKSMEKCAKAGISIHILEDYQDNSRELKRLYDNVCDQAKEVKRERVSEAFFQNIGKHLGEKSVILSAIKDGKIIGFMHVLLNGKEMIPAIVGLDYDYNREYYTYFNLFYKTVELAIDSGMEKIDMGITALNPKRDMGSDILNLNMYMKHSNPIFNKVIPVLFDMITPPDTTAPRNVFKEGA